MSNYATKYDSKKAADVIHPHLASLKWDVDKLDIDKQNSLKSIKDKF